VLIPNSNRVHAPIQIKPAVSPTTKALGGPPKVDPETGSLPKDSPRQTARVSLSSNPAAAPAPAAAAGGGGGGGGAEPYVKVTSTVTTATTTTTSNFIIRTSTLDFKVCSARPRHFADVFPSLSHVALLRFLCRCRRRSFRCPHGPQTTRLLAVATVRVMWPPVSSTSFCLWVGSVVHTCFSL